MQPHKYRALSSAGEVFKTLGKAVGDLQLYSERHPRFSESIKNLSDRVRHYFKTHADSTHITFTIRRGQPEFRRIPLVDLGSHGERLVQLLSDSGAAGLQLQRDIDQDELLGFLRVLFEKAKAQKQAQISTKSTDEQEKPQDTRVARFRFISNEAAETYSRASKHVGDQNSEEALFMPEFFVSESSVLSMFDSFRSLLGHAESGDQLDLDLISKATDEATSLFTVGDLCAGSAISNGYFDDFTFHHSVNVCMLTTHVASRLVRDETFLSRVSLAALLHDVGKSRIPLDILHKPGRLTAAELSLMQTHPALGADILLGISKVDPLCVSVAFGHHMHGETGSYPETKLQLELDWITQLVSVVDIYEALTAVRPYKTGLSSERAFAVMLMMPGLRERLGLVKLLYDTVGPYPTGSFVELENGERAVVIEQNPQTPRFPRVRILADHRGNRVSQEVDLSLPGSSDELTSIAASVVCQHPDDDPLQVDVEPQIDKISEELADNNLLMTREG